MPNTYNLGDLLEHPYTGCIWSIYEIDYEDEAFYMRLVETYSSVSKHMFSPGSLQRCSFRTMNDLLVYRSPMYAWTRHKPTFEIET
jgi:hypothetical protein